MPHYFLLVCQMSMHRDTSDVTDVDGNLEVSDITDVNSTGRASDVGNVDVSCESILKDTEKCSNIFDKPMFAHIYGLPNLQNIC